MTDVNSETKPELSKDQKLALFEAYDDAQRGVDVAHAEVDAAVRAISAACGSGPFKWKGHELVIVKQRGGGGVTMRSAGKSAEEIG